MWYHFIRPYSVSKPGGSPYMFHTYYPCIADYSYSPLCVTYPFSYILQAELGEWHSNLSPGTTAHTWSETALTHWVKYGLTTTIYIAFNIETEKKWNNQWYSMNVVVCTLLKNKHLYKETYLCIKLPWTLSYHTQLTIDNWHEYP